MEHNPRTKRVPRLDNDTQTNRSRTKVVPRQVAEHSSDEENDATRADYSPPPMARKTKPLASHPCGREPTTVPKSGPRPGRKERDSRKEEVNEECESDEDEVPHLLTASGSVFRLPVEVEQEEAPKKSRRPRRKKNAEGAPRQPESEDETVEDPVPSPPHSTARRVERSASRSPPPRPVSGRPGRDASPPPRSTARPVREASRSPPPRPVAGRSASRSPPPRPVSGRPGRDASPPPRSTARPVREASRSPPPRPVVGRGASRSPPPRSASVSDHGRFNEPDNRRGEIRDNRQPPKDRSHDRSRDAPRYSEPPRSTVHRTVDHPRSSTSSSHQEPVRKTPRYTHANEEFSDEEQDDHLYEPRGAPRSEPRYRDDRSDRHSAGPRGYEAPHRQYHTDPRPITQYDDHRGRGYEKRGQHEHERSSPSRYNDSHHPRDHQQTRQPVSRVPRYVPDHGYAGRPHHEDYRQPAAYDARRTTRGHPDEYNHYPRDDYYQPPRHLAPAPHRADYVPYPPARGYRDEYEYETGYVPPPTQPIRPAVPLPPAIMSPAALALQRQIEEEETRLLIEQLNFDEEQADQSRALAESLAFATD